MSYSIVLLPNLFFHFLDIIWTLKFFYNFSNCTLLIFQMVKQKKGLFFKIVEIWKFVNVSNLKIPNIWLFSKLVNHSNLENYPVIRILNFWVWILEFQKSKMKINEKMNSAEYQMDEQNENLPIFGIKLWFSKLKKNPKFYNFEIHQISIIDKIKKNQSSEIVGFQKLANL